MRSHDDRDRRRAEAHGVGASAPTGRRVGFLGPLLPTAVACRTLSCSLEVPETIVVGRPAPFYLHVKNRAPTSLVLTLPSSRSGGWTVDGVPEAGAGRYEPPGAAAELAFGPRERRTFVGRWDGQLQECNGDGDVWRPASGTCELRAYVAVDRWEARGVSARATVRVVDADRLAY